MSSIARNAFGKSLAMTVALVLGACSSSTSDSPDLTGNFVGRWTYQPGSKSVTTCPGMMPLVVDLSNAPPQNKAASFMLTAEGKETVHEHDDLQCDYDWAVDADGTATAAPNQTCDHIPDGRGGTSTIRLVSATKSTTDGRTLNIRIDGEINATCTLEITGTASKQ